MSEEQLTAEQKQRWEQCSAWFSNMVVSAGRTERVSDVEAAIRHVYTSKHFDPPVIFWCDSIWQMYHAPQLVQLLLSARLDGSLSRWLQGTLDDDLSGKLFAQIDNHYPALNRLVRSSSTHRTESYEQRGTIIGSEPAGRLTALWSELGLPLDIMAPRSDFLANLPAVAVSDRRYLDDIERGARIFDAAFVSGANPYPRLQWALRAALRSQPAPSMYDSSLKASLNDILGRTMELNANRREQIRAWFDWDWMDQQSQIRAHLRLRTDVFRLLPKMYESAGREREELEPEKLSVLQSQLLVFTELFAHIAFERIVFVCHKPVSVRTNSEGNLHNATGPALEFADGLSTYCWEGVMVPRQVIEHPERINVADIEAAENAEVRRVMIERYGIDRFILDSGAEVVSRDEFGTLYRKQMPGDEPLQMVQVLNSTEEPDGSHRSYFLRVPPTVSSAREAVAWTFAFDSEQYCPGIET